MRPEALLQRKIRDHIAKLGLRTVACSNGAVLAGDGRARAIQMNTLKALGLTPGYPDLIVYGPDARIGHIECKIEGEKQEPKQIEVEAWLTAWGHKYAVCRSLADVDETFSKWGWV